MGTLTLNERVVDLPGLPDFVLSNGQAILLLEVCGADIIPYIQLFGRHGANSGKVRDAVLTKLTKTKLVSGVIQDGEHVWDLTGDGLKVVKAIQSIVTRELDIKKDAKALAKTLDFETRMRSGYYSIDNAAASEFHDDLLNHYGVIDNPKANTAYNLAWQYGHSNGFHEVYNFFDDLVELIK
jgi:hypothetical protein